MARYFKDWLAAYMEYTAHLESPEGLHYWTGVSTIAGAVRRKVWISQHFYQWVPNFFIIFVGLPGFIAKTTTLSIGMDLLKQVEGAKLGPNVATWQGFVDFLEEAREDFPFENGFQPMCAMTCAPGELGTFLDPRDRAMINIMIDLWDGKTGTWEKITKHSGNNSIVNPWLNLISGTTPSWLTDNVSSVMLQGGFFSRCICIYAEHKRFLAAYPRDTIPPHIESFKTKLIADLQHISTLIGEFTISPAAKELGQKWYEDTYHKTPDHLMHGRMGVYLSRRQTHLHKLAMIIALSRHDDLTIHLQDLQEAIIILSATEFDMVRAFESIGKVQSAFHSERIVTALKRSGGKSLVSDIWIDLMNVMNLTEFTMARSSLLEAGKVRLLDTNQGVFLELINEHTTEAETGSSALHNLLSVRANSR